MLDFCLIWALQTEPVTIEPRLFLVPTLAPPCPKYQAPDPRGPSVNDGEVGAYKALQRAIQAALLPQLLLLRKPSSSPPWIASKIPTGHMGFRLPVLRVPTPLETSAQVLLVWRPVISNQQITGYCRQSHVEAFLLLLGMPLWP